MFHSQLIAQAWAEVRDEKNGDVDWVIIGYENGSKTNVTVTNKGSGGVESCCNALPEDEPVFGGIRLRKNGRFISFFYSGEGTSIIRKVSVFLEVLKYTYYTISSKFNLIYDLKPSMI